MAKTIVQALNQIATKSRCTSCGHEVHSTLGEVKKKPQFACPCCGDDCNVGEAAAWVELRVRKTWLKRVA